MKKIVEQKQESNYDIAIRELKELEHKRVLFKTNRKEFKKLVAKEQQEKRKNKENKRVGKHIRDLKESKYYEVLKRILACKNVGDKVIVTTSDKRQEYGLRSCLIRYSKRKRIPELSITHYKSTITITILNTLNTEQ